MRDAADPARGDPQADHGQRRAEQESDHQACSATVCSTSTFSRATARSQPVRSRRYNASHSGAAGKPEPSSRRMVLAGLGVVEDEIIDDGAAGLRQLRGGQVDHAHAPLRQQHVDVRLEFRDPVNGRPEMAPFPGVDLRVRRAPLAQALGLVRVFQTSDAPAAMSMRWAYPRVRPLMGADCAMYGYTHGCQSAYRRCPARSAHLLDIIANMTGLGAWELAVDSMTPLWSQPRPADLRHRPVRALTLEDILEHATRRGPAASSKLPFGRLSPNGKSFDLTLPAIRTDGARLWVRCVGDAEVVDERTVRLSGAVQDVTQQHEAGLRLQRASRFSFQGHWEYDFGTDQVWCSEGYQQLLGYPAPGAAGAGGGLPCRDLARGCRPRSAPRSSSTSR